MSAPTVFGALLSPNERLSAGHRYLVHLGTQRAFGGDAWREYLLGRDWDPEDSQPVALTPRAYAFTVRNGRDRSVRDGIAALAMAATVSNNLGVDLGAILVYDPGEEPGLLERVIDVATQPIEDAANAARGAAQQAIAAGGAAATRIVGAVDETGRSVRQTAENYTAALKYLAIGLPIVVVAGAAIYLVHTFKGGK